MMWPHSSFDFWGYNLSDVNGFERDPLFENVNFSESSSFQFNGSTIKFKNDVNGVSFQTSVDLGIDDVLQTTGSVGWPFEPEDESTTWLAGIKNGKVWVGEFDRVTKKQKSQWISSGNFGERNISIHTGYGEYENIYIQGLRPVKYVSNEDAYAFELSIAYQGDYIGTKSYLYVLNKDKVIEVPADDSNGRFSYLYNWYEDSFILLQYDEATFSKYNTTVFSKDGKVIETKGNVWDYYVVSTDYNMLTPISYSESIVLRYGEAERVSFDNGVIWHVSIDEISNIPGDAKITKTLVDKSSDVWKYKWDILYYDGTKKTVEFTIDINTGEYHIL